MITIRHISRLWMSRDYSRLLGQLLAPRFEVSARLTEELAGPDAAAAMIVIRLDELSQTFAPLYSEAIRSLVRNQRADGGWGDPIITAVALRALFCGRGHGLTVDRGLKCLANLQRGEGIWPAEPVRRMPADAYVSAFILMQLSDRDEFHRAVRFDEAMNWFRFNEPALDEPSRKLWQFTRLRCQNTLVGGAGHRRDGYHDGFDDQSKNLKELFAVN